jgi:hypothetical protein
LGILKSRRTNIGNCSGVVTTFTRLAVGEAMETRPP